MSLNNVDGMLCLACQHPIDAGEGTTCPTCGAPHHTACWEKSGGCSAPNCPDRRPIVVPEQTLPPPPPLPPGYQAAPDQMGFTPVAFDLGSIISTGWAQYMKHWMPLFFGYLIMLVISMVLGLIPVAGNVISLFITPPLMGGIILISLRAVNNHNPEVGDLFTEFQEYLKWLGVYFLYMAIGLACMVPLGIAALVGWLVSRGANISAVSMPDAMIGPLVVGGIISAVIAIPILLRLMLVYYLAAEGNGVIESFRKSWVMTHGRLLKIFGISFVLGLLSMLGIIACGIGILFTMPFYLSASAAMYNAVKTEQRMEAGQPVLQ
ncbi:MAG: RING finger protein [Armatimonadota bacterium]